MVKSAELKIVNRALSEIVKIVSVQFRSNYFLLRQAQGGMASVVEQLFAAFHHHGLDVELSQAVKLESDRLVELASLKGLLEQLPVCVQLPPADDACASQPSFKGLRC